MVAAVGLGARHATALVLVRLAAVSVVLNTLPRLSGHAPALAVGQG